MSVDLNGRQKAAMVITQLGPENAGKVLSLMSEVEVVEIMGEVAKLPTLEAEIVEGVLGEFVHRATALLSVAQGGVEAARKMLRERLGSARADDIVAKFLEVQAKRPLWFLESIAPAQVAGFLAEEHPQVIAVVLAQVTPEFAAAVLKDLDPSLQAEVAMRIATMGRIPVDVVDRVSAVLEKRLSSLAHAGRALDPTSGVPTLVGILNNSERAEEQQILSLLEENEPELAEEVRNQLFVFDDIVKLDDRTLQLVLRHVVPKDLALALKTASEEARSRFMANLSERAGQDLVEAIEVLGPTRMSAVEDAQRAIVRKVRELETEGEIVLNRGDDEILV